MSEQQGEAQGCLDEQEIANFLRDKLAEEDRARAAEHLLDCERCRERLTELARLGAQETQSYSSVVLDETGTGFSLATTSSAGEVLAPGTSLGRYVVLAKVGAGGMGVVYSAFDPELDRQIAIKVIRTEILQDMERAHDNLREEARAMAQLTHPNVVRVYDVGTQGDLVYIAMEFIEGEDLLSFAKRHQKRGEWRPILDACLAAGRGLQAAHDAGLVHRDFKPSNVLVAKDGRVFVADFGLTRLFSKTEGGSVGWTSASGTPGYAAPEQLAGEATDARSDQYSFCVASAQCLFGRDPMSIFTRLDRDEGNELKTPKRFAPLLERGLAAKAEERHESMQGLLQDLVKAAKPGHRPALLLAGAGALAGVGLLMFVLGGRSAAASDLCGSGAERFDRLWPEQRRAKLDVLLASTRYNKHSSYFLETTDRVSSGLVDEQRHSCKATFVAKTQSAELFDRQMFCLNSQATELEAIISMVEEGVSVEVGQSSLGALPSVSECRVTESLLATKPPPSDEASLASIQAVEDLLAERRVLQAASKPSEALKRVESAITMSKEIGYGPLIARAESQKAVLLERLERFGEARQAAERARDAASEGRDTRRLIIALLRLASIVNTHEDDTDEAVAFVATARSLSLGIELPTIDKIEVEITSGTLAQTGGDHVKAKEYADAGLKLLESMDQEDSEAQGSKIMLLQILAAAHFAAGELGDAKPLLWTIHELKEKRLGPEHSQLAVSLTNIATVDYQLGKLEDSLATLSRVRELLRSPDAAKSDLGQVSSLEALIQNRLGHLPEAIKLHQETIEIYKEVFGEDHANIWRTKANLANTFMALGRWEETLEIQRGFASWAIERYGADSPTAIAAKLNLASTTVQAHYEDGEVEEGQRLLEALAKELPEGHPTLVNIRLMQGNAFLAKKEFAKAADTFETVLKLNKSTPNPEPSFPATTTGAYADALWQAGKQKRALVVAKQALALYDKLSSPLTELRAEQAKWIEEKESER